MSWEYGNNLFDEALSDKYVGFVYIIINLDNQKYYIGKKNFTRIKRYQKNKKSKKMLVESDWHAYTGSNDLLNEDIRNGANIKKEILYLCTSKSEMSYLEAREQFLRNVLLDVNSYNQWIMVKVRKSHILKKPKE